MSLVAFLPLLLSLGLALVPVWLLRGRSGTRAQDNFVSSRAPSPPTIRNASVAHALRMAVFGPFLVLGAQGDFWPVLIATAGLGAGISLLALLRRPILEFIAGALESDGSITVHAFIARQHGGHARVRIFAAALTLFALTALIAGEAFALAGFLKLIAGNDMVARALTLGALLLAALYAFPAGHAGSMHAAQLQLAAMFFGLFGATAVLLYLHVSALTPLPPHAIFAILFVAAWGVALLIYRRSRYLDTAPVVAGTRGAKWLSTFGKILNPFISVFVVLVVVLALMEFYAAGFTTIPGAIGAVLRADTSLSVTGLIALALLPLFYPLADVTNWQNLAAMEKSKKGYKGDVRRWTAALRHFLRLYAVEGALLWLFITSLGAIAVAATDIPIGRDGMAAFVRELTAGDNPLGAAVFSLLLVGIFAIALSAMSAAFSAALCTIGYDMLPAEDKDNPRGAIGPRVFFLVVIAVLGLADVTLRIDFTSTVFLALVFALGAPPLAFAPLLLGPLLSGRSISPPFALGVLGGGAAACIGALIAFAVSANEIWLWAAVPAALGAGCLAFAAAAFGQGSRMR